MLKTVVGILTFMSGKKSMLSRVEHGKDFITLGPDQIAIGLHCVLSDQTTGNFTVNMKRRISSL